MRRALLALLAAGCASATAAPPPPDGGLTWRGDFCSADADCGWDDPCMPARCGKRPAKGVPCEESAPPPGDCVCVERQCTLRPKDVARSVSSGRCARDDECAIDVATATCHAGGTTLIGPITTQGPVCLCDGHCKLAWTGPVACKSYRDCSWVTKPRLRPVPAREVRRPHKGKVRPCKDGEVDSVCGDDGYCRIVGWSC